MWTAFSPSKTSALHLGGLSSTPEGCFLGGKPMKTITLVNFGAAVRHGTLGFFNKFN